MTTWNITMEQLAGFQVYLKNEERSTGTVEKYIRDVRQFIDWLDDRPLTKEEVLNWKEALIHKEYQPVTINGKLAALNCFFEVQGWQELRVKSLKIQRRVFRDQEREMTKEEYERLVFTARAGGRERLALLMETICATGIRVGEVKYITAEAIAFGRVEISLKGKIRVILIPGKLRKKLMKYVRKKKITEGPVFVTRTGQPLSRKQIWAEMKSLCEQAGVEATKVFPHNLRHLFARCFYKLCRDLVKLADVLGHSNVETTRIYLVSSGEEHARTLSRLGLVT